MVCDDRLSHWSSARFSPPLAILFVRRCWRAGVSAAAPADSSLSSAARSLIPLIYLPHRIYNKIMTHQFHSKGRVLVFFHFWPSFPYASLSKISLSSLSVHHGQQRPALTWWSEKIHFQVIACAFGECRVEFGDQIIAPKQRAKEKRKWNPCMPADPDVLVDVALSPGRFIKSLVTFEFDGKVEVRGKGWELGVRGMLDVTWMPFPCTCMFYSNVWPTFTCFALFYRYI